MPEHLMASNFVVDNIIISFPIEYFTSLYILLLILYCVSFNGYTVFSNPAVLSSSVLFSFYAVVFSLVFFSCFDNVYLFTDNRFSSFMASSCFGFLLLLSFSLLHWVSKNTLQSQKFFKYEYDVLVMFSVLGLLVLNNCSDLLCFYLAIELQSLGFYVLATFHRSSEYNAEAGLKYFVLGAISSALLLFGFFFIYCSYGSIFFNAIVKLTAFDSNSFLSTMGFLSILCSLLFKLGAFPFHQWLCDVYDGSSITVTALFSSIPKMIVFGLVLKLVTTFSASLGTFVEYALLFSGFSSITLSSIAALYQKRTKRLLAYSTISHTGFILVAIACNSIESSKTTVIYLPIYVMMTLTIFVIVFTAMQSNRVLKFLLNWKSFAINNLNLSVAFTCMLFSVAGIPPLAGFYSKLNVFSCALYGDLVVIPAAIAVLSSVSCFYYIRLIRIFYFTENVETTFWIHYCTNAMNSAIISLFVLLTVLGIFRIDLLLNLALVVGLHV